MKSGLSSHAPYTDETRQTEVLQRHLASHDAVLLADMASLPYKTSDSQSSDYFLLVPHEISKSTLPSIPKGLQRPTIVTDLWLERCLYKKQLVSPSKHVLDTPFFESPIKGMPNHRLKGHASNIVLGFDDITISSTAFHDIDLLHVSKVVPLIGMFTCPACQG